jgi:hypothetical protein
MSSELVEHLRDLLSLKLLVPMSRLQRMVRPSRRAATQSFVEGMRFRSRTLNWDLETRRSWILQRLRFVVRRAYLGTPYYRELFDSVGFDPHAEFTFEDFRKLPVLSRQDISKAGEKLQSQPKDKQVLLQATGGSDGVPTEVLLGPEDRSFAWPGRVGVGRERTGTFQTPHRRTDRFADCFTLGTSPRPSSFRQLS